MTHGEMVGIRLVVMFTEREQMVDTCMCMWKAKGQSLQHSRYHSITGVGLVAQEHRSIRWTMGPYPSDDHEVGWIHHPDVSWVMTHGACGDEMQTDGGEYEHMEQYGRTIHDICIVRALVLYHCV